MARGTVSAQIQVKSIVLFVKAHLPDALQQPVIVILPLASADNLTDAGHQTVHRRDRPAVVVQLHIECFYFFRIICDKYRPFVHHLGQIALVLCLQIRSPGYFILKLIIVLLQDPDRLRVGHAGKVGIHDIVETFQQSLVDKTIEKRHLLRRILQNIADNIL